MCVIIDICVAHRAIDTTDVDFQPLRDSLMRGDQVLVIGGYLLQEYARYARVVKFVAELDRAGRVRVEPNHLVEAETKRVDEMNICVSNDAHVIGLARVSGARLLCSTDAAAGADFKNKQLIDSPRGKVYKDRTHAHLLRRRCRRRNSSA